MVARFFDHRLARVYYDQDCRLCRFVRTCLNRTDFFGNLEWLPLVELYDSSLNGSLSMPDAVVLEIGDGSIFRGYYAVKSLCWRLPLLMPLIPVLCLPGMDSLGNIIYSWFAAHRCTLFQCNVKGLENG